ncbi:MAG: hypothetical protein K1X92_11635 [Bacteroidia bacterium]|nr:hypothetical protein [Bacteroidia bacterium]
MKKIILVCISILIFFTASAQRVGWRFEVGSGAFVNRNDKTGFGVGGYSKEEWAFVGYNKALLPYPNFSYTHFGGRLYFNFLKNRLQLHLSGNYSIFNYEQFEYKYIHHGTWTEIIFKGTMPFRTNNITLGGGIGYRIINKPDFKTMITLSAEKSLAYKMNWRNYFTYDVGFAMGYSILPNHTLWLAPKIGWFRDLLDKGDFSQHLIPQLSLMYDIDRIKKKKE